MDTNTGQILTPDKVKEELEKAMLQTGKELDLAREIKADPAEAKMTADQMMAKFMPDHVPLKRLPTKACKRCYGVGHLGKNLTTNKYVPCSCTQ